VTPRKLAPIHPGEVLHADFLEPLGIYLEQQRDVLGARLEKEVRILDRAS
jgi:plasmid maintenance system antidote protein VapI